MTELRLCYQPHFAVNEVAVWPQQETQHDTVGPPPVIVPEFNQNKPSIFGVPGSTTPISRTAPETSTAVLSGDDEGVPQQCLRTAFHDFTLLAAVHPEGRFPWGAM